MPLSLVFSGLVRKIRIPVDNIGAVPARWESVYTMEEKNIKVYSNGLRRKKGRANTAYGLFINPS
jgi:hypothetical protein